MSLAKIGEHCSLLISGLTRDFDAVFLLEPASGCVQCLRFNEDNVRLYGSDTQFNTVDDMLSSIRKTAHPDDYAVMEKMFRDPLGALKNRDVFYFDYRSLRGSDYVYFRFKLIKIDEEGKEYLIGFSDVDASVREEKLAGDVLSKRLAEQAAFLDAEYARNKSIQKDIVEGMATLVESRDLKTGQHVAHTRKYVNILLDRLYADGAFPETVTPQYIDDVCLASVLHDIGKIFISDVLLNKPGKLSPEEFEIIKTHTTLGAEIVDRVFAERLNPQVLGDVRDIVLGHHEKWNGTGYPNHIAGDDIPLAARVMAVADVFDALVSKRAYKDEMSLDTAFGILIKDSGTHFDKRLVDAFVAEREQIEAYVTEQEKMLHDESATNLFKEFGDFERKLQQESIVRSLTEDYELVLYCEPELDRITVVRQSENIVRHVNYDSLKTLTFSEFASLSSQYIFPDDRERYLDEIGKDTIRSQFGDSSVRFYTFRRESDDGYRWYQLKKYRLGKTDDEQFNVLIGINDVHGFELAKQAEKEALAEAKQRAESANAAKSDFIYHISHDIRTPFSNIVSLTDMALKHADDPAALREYLIKIKQSEDTLLGGMNAILEIETMEGGETKAAAAEIAPESEASDDPGMDEITLAGRRLLLVEDNELNREIGASILEECGAEVESAEDGTVAVELVKSHEAHYYDAVLMDLQMEIMGGIEATAAIRALPDKEAADVPIVAMTANAFEKDKIAVFEAGMNGYLTKPIDVPVLLKTLKPLLK